MKKVELLIDVADWRDDQVTRESIGHMANGKIVYLSNLKTAQMPDVLGGLLLYTGPILSFKAITGMLNKQSY